MNKEVKEILEDLQMFIQGDYLLEDVLNEKKAKILLDYITNLQKENEEFKKQFNKVVENLQQPYLLDCEQQCKDCLEILGVKYDG